MTKAEYAVLAVANELQEQRQRVDRIEEAVLLLLYQLGDHMGDAHVEAKHLLDKMKKAKGSLG